MEEAQSLAYAARLVPPFLSLPLSLHLRQAEHQLSPGAVPEHGCVVGEAAIDHAHATEHAVGAALRDIGDGAGGEAALEQVLVAQEMAHHSVLQTPPRMHHCNANVQATRALVSHHTTPHHTTPHHTTTQHETSTKRG